MNVARKGFIVGVATARAEKFRPATLASRLSQHVIFTESARRVHIEQARLHIADHIPVPTDELMTGIDISVRHNRHVFMSRAAAAQTLLQTRTAIKIHIEMEKLERTTFALAIQIRLRQFFVLRENLRQMFFRNRERVVFTDDRFHRKFVETLVHHIKHVGRKIKILGRVRAAHVVFFAVTMLHRVRQVVADRLVRTLAAHPRTHLVMHFFTTVQTQHETDMLLIEILHLALIQQHAVGRQRQLENLVVFFLLRADIIDRLLHHMVIHQRLAAEEIDLAMFTRTGMRDQKINRPTRRIKTHQLAPFTVTALARKAVAATQIAVMRDI